ncbi:MAG: ATP/GTP-binding protein, partial [Planctomycetota bacterium]
IELVLGKADLMSDIEEETILGWCTSPEALLDELGRGEMGMNAIAATEFLKTMENLGAHKVPLPVSSLGMTGIEDLYNTIQQLFFGGEDLRPD